MKPTIAGPAPSVAVRKIGSSGVIISLAASFSSDTSPSTTTVRGSARLAAAVIGRFSAPGS